MATSKRFKELKAEIRRLHLYFLPQKWNPTGTYSQRKLDRARAFRILAHTEIEYFIENAILDVVEREYSDWNSSKKPNYTMICLLAATKLGWQDIETERLALEQLDTPKIKKDDVSIHQFIERVVEQFKDIIKENNGIKSRDLKRLLMPLGIALSDLDPIWLNDMDSYGGQRGFVAHTSRLGIRTSLDPKTEKETVDKILTGLEDLDKLVSKL
jgi:HEPN superfamily RiboL-PSP-like protein